MTIQSILRSPVHNCLATVILVAAAVLILTGGNNGVEADEFPAFFLKAAKSVPRIGRRSGTFEDFYLKASKSIPRIGRRGYAPASVKATESWPWFSKGSVDFSGDDHWSPEDYIRAMEESPKLWEMISADEGAGSPAVAGSNNDQLWKREKRTGSEQAEG